MSMLNPDKIRPDILQCYNENPDLLTEINTAFLQKYSNDHIPLFPLLQKNMEISHRFIRREITQEENYAQFTPDEISYLIKYFRFYSKADAIYHQQFSPLPKNVKIEAINANGVSAEWQIAPNAAPDKVILYIQGGAFFLGSPLAHRNPTAKIGQYLGMRILSIDYRLAPEHPFPAGLDDCVSAYKWLLSSGYKAKNILIMGDSAGGNLTLTTLLRLKEEGIEYPAGAVPISPVTDCTLTDDKFYENIETDGLVDMGVGWWLLVYEKHKNLRNPLLSPLFGDLEGLPPLLLQAGTVELLHGDAVRFVNQAKAAGVDATLQAWEDMFHCFQIGFLQEQKYMDQFPEATEALNKIKEFSRKVIPSLKK